MKLYFRVGSRTTSNYTVDNLRSILLHKRLGVRYMSSKLTILDLKILIQNSYSIDLNDLVERIDPEIRSKIDYHIVDKVLAINYDDINLSLDREIVIYSEKDIERLEKFLQNIQNSSISSIESLKFYFYLKEDRDLFKKINSLLKTYCLDLSTLQYLDIIRSPANFSFEYRDEEIDISRWYLNPKMIDSIILNSNSDFRSSYLFSLERPVKVRFSEPLNYLFNEFKKLIHQNRNEEINQLVSDYYISISNLYTIVFENSIYLQDILNRTPSSCLQELFNYSYSDSVTRTGEEIYVRFSDEKSLILKNIVKSAIQSSYVFSYLKELTEDQLKKLSPILSRNSIKIIENRRQELSYHQINR